MNISKFLINLAQSRRDVSYYSNWSWPSHSIIQDNIKDSIIGSYPAENIYDYIYLKYGKEINDIIEIGCGDGHVLYNMNKHKIGNSYTGVDISKIGITKAKKRFYSIKSNFYELDINSSYLEGKYDFVVLWHSMHHIKNLKNLINIIKSVLKRSGLLLVYDYFGPNRMQYNKIHVKLLNKILAELPLELRNYRCNDPFKITYAYLTGQLKRKYKSFYRIKYKNLPKLLVKLRDPSEAVRSEDMYDLLINNFEIVEDIGLPGALFEPIFDYIILNFRDKKDNGHLFKILHTEKYYYQRRIINPNHRWMICKIKD